MISQTAGYALRAVVYLADQKGQARTTSEIARAIVVPAGYLAKVMHSLSRAQLVHSRRGLNGGFTLNRVADELSLLDVIEAVDPWQRFVDAPLDNPTHNLGLCELHRRLDETALHVKEVLRETTIAQLLAVPTHQ